MARARPCACSLPPRSRTLLRAHLSQTVFGPAPSCCPAASHVRFAKQRVRAQRSDDARAVPMPEGKEGVEYKDSLTDIAFIALCRVAYGNIAGFQSKQSWVDGPSTFRGMVEVSAAVMRGRSGGEVAERVISGFPQVPPWFRKVFPYSKWGAELNARITPAFFQWLVGPCEPVDIEVPGAGTQRSGVKIQRCRYLAESGCKAMCVNLCKQPTQTFFTEQLGMPLTMEPDFETLECTMKFGVHPSPIADDPVMQQPCWSTCAVVGAPAGPCPSIADH